MRFFRRPVAHCLLPIAFCLLQLPTAYCQKPITLEEIYDGAFSTRSLERLHSMNDGAHYSVLNHDRDNGASTVDVYAYSTGEKTQTLVSSADFEEIDRIVSYEFSDNEKKLLIATNVEPVYRHSRLGEFYVLDLTYKSLTPATGNWQLATPIQEPTFSPSGDKLAFGFENNLYITDLETGKTDQVTADGEENRIINGITDWVYEEEFAFVRAFDWNATGDKLAFLRFDETEVPEFSMDIYGNGLYQTQDVFKYPKAGEKNAEVSLHIYDLNTAQTTEIDLSAYESYYLPRLQWTKDRDMLSVQGMNRRQNALDLVFVDARDFSTKRILREMDDAYVDVTDNLTFLDDHSFIWTSEKSGWNHIYHYNKKGKLLRQLTDGPWEVTRYYGYDSKNKRIFYQSTQGGAINRDVYSVRLNGRGKTRLTEGPGTHTADFSTDFSRFIHTFQNVDTPPVYTLRDAKNGKPIREIQHNRPLREKLATYQTSPKEFSTVKISGHELNMYLIKPPDFDENEVYPLLLFQYSGPGSQMVRNVWHGINDYWHQMLAQEGYIIACVDGRGTGLKGRDFKKTTQLQLGRYEVEDQIAFAKKLGERPYIDASRIGIWGWSYGGFMSANCLFQGADTFAMAIAVAPVTSWRFYDTIYTERYMDTPQHNPDGYDDNSPLSHVDRLEGAFLLVHGSADDNVHLQNTTRLVEAMVQADKPFDWAIYPDKNHGIYGGNTRLHLYKKMTRFIRENL